MASAQYRAYGRAESTPGGSSIVKRSLPFVEQLLEACRRLGSTCCSGWPLSNTLLRDCISEMNFSCHLRPRFPGIAAFYSLLETFMKHRCHGPMQRDFDSADPRSGSRGFVGVQKTCNGVNGTTNVL